MPSKPPHRAWSRPRADLAIYAPAARLFYEKDPPPSLASGGGAELQTTKLAAGLAERGRIVAHIVYPVDAMAETPPNLRVVERAHYVGGGGPFAKLREALAIARSLAAANAEVHILRCFGVHLPVGVLYAKLRRRRVIVSGSNDIDFEPAAHGARGLSQAVYRWAFRAADLIVCQTEQQATIARRAFPRRRTVVIRSFAEPAPITQAPPEAFLWVGRIVDYKRPLAFVELARRLPELRFRMVCVASGETRSELLQQVERQAGSTPNLELLDGMPRDRLLDLIARSYAIVLTSQAEGMPNVLLEAWMRGVPALSLGFDPDGAIAREGAGLVAGEDLEALVDAARQLAGDSELRIEMGGRGRDFLLAQHAPEQVLDAWERAVDSL